MATVPKKIIVGYTTKTVPDVALDFSGVVAPANYKDQTKIDEYVARKQAEMTAAAANCPYTGTFDTVDLFDVSTKNVARFDSAKRSPGGVSTAVKNWLMGLYPDAWQHTTHPDHAEPPAAIIIGFDPKLFLKILGIECSLPSNQPQGGGYALPLSLWYGNSDHRDIEEAVMPAGYSQLVTWPMVLKARGLDKTFSNWTAPSLNSHQDLLLATALAGQLCMI